MGSLKSLQQRLMQLDLRIRESSSNPEYNRRRPADAYINLSPRPRPRPLPIGVIGAPGRTNSPSRQPKPLLFSTDGNISYNTSSNHKRGDSIRLKERFPQNYSIILDGQVIFMCIQRYINNF